MQRLIWLGLLCVMGCQNVIGPRERRVDPVKVDNPFLSIPEQERSARELLATPQQSFEVGPPTYSGLPQLPESR